MMMFKAFQALAYFESAVSTIGQTLIYEIFVHVSEDTMAAKQNSILCQTICYSKSSQYRNF